MKWFAFTTACLLALQVSAYQGDNKPTTSFNVKQLTTNPSNDSAQKSASENKVFFHSTDGNGIAGLAYGFNLKKSTDESKNEYALVFEASGPVNKNSKQVSSSDFKGLDRADKLSMAFTFSRKVGTPIERVYPDTLIKDLELRHKESIKELEEEISKYQKILKIYTELKEKIRKYQETLKSDPGNKEVISKYQEILKIYTEHKEEVSKYLEILKTEPRNEAEISKYQNQLETYMEDEINYYNDKHLIAIISLRKLLQEDSKNTKDNTILSAENLTKKQEKIYKENQISTSLLFTLQLTSARQKFNYLKLDSMTPLEEEKENHTQNEFSFVFGVIPKEGLFRNNFIGLTYKNQNFYKAKNEVNVCYPIDNSTFTQCISAVTSAPTQVKNDLLTLECRHLTNSLGLNPKYTRNFEKNTYQIDLPVYFIRPKDEKLFNGGIALAWNSEDKEISLSLFVGQPLKF